MIGSRRGPAHKPGRASRISHVAAKLDASNRPDLKARSYVTSNPELVTAGQQPAAVQGLAMSGPTLEVDNE